MTDDADIDDLARHAQIGGELGRDAFERLVRRLTPVLIGFFQKKGGVDAEELTQQTWFRVASRFEQYDPEKDFKRWLFAIAYYEWVNVQRLRDRTPGRLIEEPAAQSEEELFEERLARLEECMEQLSADERTIIYLRYWEKLSLEEVAERMETPYGRMKGMAYRAVEKLRKCMGAKD